MARFWIDNGHGGFDAGGGFGYDVIYSNGGGASLELANRIAAEFDKLGQKRHGVFYRLGDDGRDYYAMIRMVKAPSVIAEYAFIDSPDYTHIGQKSEQDDVAEAIAKAMLEQAGINWIEEGNSENVNRLVISYGDGDWPAASLAAYKYRCAVILREIFESNREANKANEYYIVGGPEDCEIGVKGAYVYHFSGEGRLQSALKALE